MSDTKTVKFNFKARSIRDEGGNVVGKSKKQDSLEVAMPLLSAQEVVDILTDSTPTEDGTGLKRAKEMSLIVDAVNGILISQARDQFDEIIEGFGEDNTKQVTVEMLDFSKLNLEYIASIPPAQRGAAAISEEEWKAFYQDYLPVMLAATGKEEARLKVHLEIFNKPQKVRANKPVLTAMMEQLDIYMAASKAIEDTGVCAERLREKFQRWHDEPEKVITLDVL